MSKRRSHGEGTIFWEERRQRWVAEATIGYDGRGKRVRKKATGRTQTDAKNKLAEVIRDLDDGLVDSGTVTVGDAVEEWLAYGINGTTDNTKSNYETLCRTHVISSLGAYRLKELKAVHVDRWLADLSPNLSTRTLRLVHSLLNRAVNHAMARDLVRRNVVGLVDVPAGRAGRPSRSLTIDQAQAILDQAEGRPFYAYVVVSLLTGARTEEMRALTWHHTHLDGEPDAARPLPPYIEVWRSVRLGNDTKTRQSRRTIALPSRCVDVLRSHLTEQSAPRRTAGDLWHDNDLVFCSRTGDQLDATAARYAFRKSIEGVDGIDPADWTPRELRHSFVSILSDQGIPIEEISQLVGHSSTNVTETIYRHQIRPIVNRGAETMDEIF